MQECHTYVQSIISSLSLLLVRTESQLLADPTVRAAAMKTDILFSVGVRQQEAVQILRSGAAPHALQLAFDGNATLEAANRLQVCRGTSFRFLSSNWLLSGFKAPLLLAAQLVDACAYCRRHHPLTSLWHMHLLYSRHAQHQSARPRLVLTLTVCAWV